MNYQHLLYFRTVALCGGITAAAQRLRLTPPTLSAQIRALEEAMGVQLFERTARGMSLTDPGRLALGYADRIFALGAELELALRRGARAVMRVGVESSLVSATVRPILSRLSNAPDCERLVCSFGAHQELFAALRARELEVVLTSEPLPTGTGPEIVSRLVDETDVGFFANAGLSGELRDGFPASLDGASFIAPPRTSLRSAIERWLARTGVRLSANVELADASLAAALAADGVGILAAPLSAEVELAKRYELERVGVADGVRAQVYAVGAAESIDALLASIIAA